MCCLSALACPRQQHATGRARQSRASACASGDARPSTHTEQFGQAALLSAHNGRFPSRHNPGQAFPDSGVDGISAFYEHLTDVDNWYLITQYIKGQTLEEYLQQAPGNYLDEDVTVTLGIVLAQIMQKLHEYNPPIIFRDLKPANIMITPEHTFFLIDFGIARNFTPGKQKDTTPLGSPGYAPPEQYGRAQTDQRATSTKGFYTNLLIHSKLRRSRSMRCFGEP